jgi:hypothetical protein
VKTNRLSRWSMSALLHCGVDRRPAADALVGFREVTGIARRVGLIYCFKPPTVVYP